MKKINGRFRSNGGNNNGHSSQVYSLNYRFDSNSIAGKCNGTALDLIKRYNELAKDALNSSDVVTAEVFRQYAEHYRKIVTDINEKKNSNPNNPNNNRQYNNRRENENSASSTESSENSFSEENGQNFDGNTSQVETSNEENSFEASSEQSNTAPRAKITTRRAFKVIEVREENKRSAQKEETSENTESKPKRIYKKKVLTAEAI